MINKLGAAAAVVALLVTGACGSNDSSSADASKSASSSGSASASASSSSGGDRPSAAELSATLQKGNKFGSQEVKLPKKQADCISKVIVDSKLSDAAVEAFAKADNGFKGSAADTAELSNIQAKARACLS